MRRLLGSVVLLACFCAPSSDDDPVGSVALGDLDRIRERGVLRVLLPDRVVVNQLPRGGFALDDERRLIEEFARHHDLEPRLIRVASRDELIPRLLAGHGDVVAGNLTATEERRRHAAFSVPVFVVHEQLVGRGDDPNPVRRVEDLAGRQIHLRRSSSFWSTVERLRDREPRLEIVAVPETMETEEILHRVARGEYDLTVADNNLVEACLAYDLNIEPRLDLTQDRAVAFAVRPSSGELLESIDRYLNAFKLEAGARHRHTEDLDGLRKRRVLRVLTRNHATTYFLWRGQLKGFEYELAGEFARRHGLRLEMVVPRAGESLYDLLREGRGDVIAAALTPPPERRLEGIRFCRPYVYVDHVVVARAAEEAPSTFEELRGRTLHVPRGSPFWRLLAPLRADFGFELESVPVSMDALELLDRVARGEYDLTLIDTQSLAIEQSWRDDLRAGVSLRDKVPLTWAVRESNPQLREAVDAFVRETYRGLFYNVVHDRYFGQTGRMRKAVSEARVQGNRLSPYDEIVKRISREWGFDWRLVTAQMYQESRFEHDARSFAGAEGLMQMMPRTARELGIVDMSDPEIAIEAGIRYLDWVRDRFEPELPVEDRMWFTLAAYNAGPGHVRDARRLAREIGLNANRWFGNVEKAMLLLSKPEFSGKASHGYVRGGQSVAYVREIRARYNSYVKTLGT